MCKQIVVLKEMKGGNVTYVSDTTHSMAQATVWGT